jgi:hypothetical protein
MVSPVIANNTFTAPTDAYYNFEAFLNLNVSGIITGSFDFSSGGNINIFPLTGSSLITAGLNYDVYDSSGFVVINNRPVGGSISGRYQKAYSPSSPLNLPYTINGSSQPVFFSLYMRAGDIISLNFRDDILNNYVAQIPISGGPQGVIFINESITLNQGSYFRCIGNSTDNPNIQVGNINNYIAYEHSFSCPMKASEFIYLKDNNRDLIEFSMFGRIPRYGWVSDIKYNWIKGTASVKLESNATNNNIA